MEFFKKHIPSNILADIEEELNAQESLWSGSLPIGSSIYTLRETFLQLLTERVQQQTKWFGLSDEESHENIYLSAINFARHEYKKRYFSRLATTEQIVHSYGIALWPDGEVKWGISPFVDGKKKSLCIKPSKNIFKCFESNEGGDGIAFIMAFEKLSYEDALTKAANIWVRATH